MEPIIESNQALKGDNPRLLLQDCDQRLFRWFAARSDLLSFHQRYKTNMNTPTQHEMNRRGFLGGILASFAAPAFVKAGILMPVKPAIWTPPQELIESSWTVNETVLTIFNAAGLVLATVPMHGDTDLSDLSKKTLAMQGDSIVDTTGVATSFELSRGGKWMVKGGVGTDLILNNPNLVTGQDLHTQFNLSMFKL